MDRFVMSDIEKNSGIHFIGIGGAGMCPLAEILLSLGYEVSGSDNNDTETFRRIEKEGAKVFLGQVKENIADDTQLVIYTNAILKGNEELEYAKANPKKEFIVATEAGILHEMQRSCPDAVFYPVPPEISEGGLGCSCNECQYMKMNTLEKIYNTLKYGWPEVNVDPVIATEAVKPIIKMLELSK